MDNNAIFNRTELLLGTPAMERIASQRVILFGVGGVGSWCAESLIRSGIRHLTIVDSDVVNVTNINRQLMATTKTIGQSKVDVLRDRLLEINPAAQITAIKDIYTIETAARYTIEKYDYIIDAIDSLEHKAQLIRHACTTSAKFFSSMGAALKLDPTRITVDEFWKVKGCPLARALRNKFKRSRHFPAKKFLCVYSDEVVQNQGEPHADDGAPQEFHKVQTNGTLAHTTAIFGFMLAGLVIQDISKR
ncbi:MAG: tRNA threonylcarbamoyladenosine dehydratase [Bacteroidaceae bacterium]|nr:tRNA threonylcarbamoyladenosine dehydratase [Bacteroidaceae bacterium]